MTIKAKAGSFGIDLTKRVSGFRHWFWLSRAMTLGVRVIVSDGQKIFLVRHTYRNGWYLPGGAVDRGESAESAAVRELKEEGGITCSARPSLHHFYRNGKGASRDHVACYIVDKFEIDPDWKSNWEIAEAAFFPLDALPPKTTRATRTRIAEFLGQKPCGEHW